MTNPPVRELLIQAVPHFLPVMGRFTILLEIQSFIGVITVICGSRKFMSILK
jgi:hypothetical protein